MGKSIDKKFTAITLTLNACIDRTIWVDRLTPGALHRVLHSRSDSSGKGINVSKALQRWGISTHAIVVVGGMSGEQIRQDLSELGLPAQFVQVRGETRINVKVIEESHGRMTELNERGAPVREKDLSEVEASIERVADDADWLVLSGSLPPGAPSDYYGQLGARYRDRLSVALDAEGDALALGLQAHPALIKPNLSEMETLLGRPLRSPDAWYQACAELQQQGVERVVLSLGEQGAVFAGTIDEGVYWAKSRPVTVKSLAGCGDIMLAATIQGMSRRWSWRDIARFATAAATAAATLEGTTAPTLDQVQAMLDGITLTRLSD